MDVVEHRARGKLFARGDGLDAPIELRPIVDVVGEERQFVLEAARPRRLPRAFPQAAADAAGR